MLRAVGSTDATVGGGKSRKSGRGAGNGKGPNGGGGTVPDPYFASVTGLFHFDGTNGSTTFTDSSSYADPATIFAGTPTISTAQSVFGGASVVIPDSSAIKTPDNARFAFGTGDLTFEFRFRPAGSVVAQNIIDGRPGGAGTHPSLLLYQLADGSLHVFVNGATGASSAAGVIVADQWHAIAYTRTGTNLGKLFVNGTKVAEWADGTTYTGTTFHIPNQFAVSGTYYYDELRITTGVARYTGNSYTVDTSAFPNS